MNNPLPTGTVTFLFTDIQGSTSLWEREPEKMAAALQIHNATLYQAIQANGGAVFKVIGDAFQAAFPTAPQALRAALEGQRNLQIAPWNELGPLKVRMGLHTGEAELDDDGEEYLVSHTKNRANRIMSAASGGQVLLSAETYELCNRQLPPQASLKDQGEHLLKGLHQPEHLYQLVAPGLEVVFPPVTSEKRPSHNLPLQLTSFIGRREEITQVQELLHHHRLVTLTGTGGVGKTRLALRVAEELLERFPDGVWLAELASLTDPELVPQSVARNLGLNYQAGPQATALLRDYLKPKHTLLILDGCEHLIDACARLAEALLGGCPLLSLLATSREVLEIGGETPFRVPSLALPDLIEEDRRDPHLYLEILAHSEAIRLFVERAEAASPGFTLNPQNMLAVAQICRHLDGIPLAIELAAARTRMMGVEEIARRLGDRFQLLTGGSRTALPRHRTLRAAIDWSYELLSAPERALLQRLAVFAGGWSLPAAEFVCRGEVIESCDVLDLLAQLADKSLVTSDLQPGLETRYRMLETVRQYAFEKLVEAGQAQRARHLHLQYYLQLAERAEGGLRGPEQPHLLDMLEGELDNLRLALEVALEEDDQAAERLDSGLRIAAALWWFWWPRHRQMEGLQWLERLLAREGKMRASQPIDPARAGHRAKALCVAGYLAYNLGETVKAGRLAEESRDLFQGLGPAGRRGLAYATYILAAFQSDNDEAVRMLGSSLAIFREVGDRFGASECLMDLGFIARGKQETTEALRCYEERLALEQAIGDRDGMGSTYLYMGQAAFDQGEDERAHTLFEQSRDIFRQIHNVTFFEPQVYLGLIEGMRGDYTRAAEYYHEILSTGEHLGNEVTISDGLSYLGMLALAQGDLQEAEERFAQSLALRYKHHLGGATVELVASLGDVAWAKGDAGLAAERYSEALSLSQEYGNPQYEAYALLGLGRVALAQGELDRARQHLLGALKLSSRDLPFSLGALRLSSWGLPHALEALALLEVAQQRMVRAARLLATTQAFHERFQKMRPSKECELRTSALEATQSTLGEEIFAQAWQAGQEMSLEQAVSFALGDA